MAKKNPYFCCPPIFFVLKCPINFLILTGLPQISSRKLHPFPRQQVIFMSGAAPGSACAMTNTILSPAAAQNAGAQCTTERTLPLRSILRGQDKGGLKLPSRPTNSRNPRRHRCAPGASGRAFSSGRGSSCSNALFPARASSCSAALFLAGVSTCSLSLHHHQAGVSTCSLSLLYHHVFRHKPLFHNHQVIIIIINVA